MRMIFRAVGKIKYKVSRKFNIGYMYVETLEGTMEALEITLLKV